MPARACRVLGGRQRAGRVIGQQGRHFQRHPTVHAVGPVVDGPEQRGGAGDVLERQIEEKILARLAFAQLLADRGVVCAAVLDGVVEDRGIRGQSRHRQLVYVAFERAAIQQVARDVVEPDTLAQIVKLLRCFRFHHVTSFGCPKIFGRYRNLVQIHSTCGRRSQSLSRCTGPAAGCDALPASRKAVRTFRQIAQPIRRLDRDIMSSRAPPAPVAFGAARDVHPRLSAQVEQVL